MRIRSLFILSVFLVFASCKSNGAMKSDVETASDKPLLVVSDASAAEDMDTAFADEYSQYEYFNLSRYIVNEEDIPKDSIAYIRETCSVQIWRPNIQEFEESEEAEDYYTAMDDLNYYMYEASSRLEALGISDTVVSNRFIKFDIEDNRSVVVDAEKHDVKLWMLLYKKGKSPLVIDIVMNDVDRAKSYLGIE